MPESVAGMGLENEISAVVIRCGCGNPLVIHPNAVCPTPRRVEHLGQLYYWHPNPVLRFFKGRYVRWRSARKIRAYERLDS